MSLVDINSDSPMMAATGSKKYSYFWEFGRGLAAIAQVTGYAGGMIQEPYCFGD